MPRQGLGALFLLAGSAVVVSASSIRGLSVGGAVGYLLLMVGSGFLIDQPRDARRAL